MLKSSGITNFKGLEGKKIGITPGNSHKFYFPKVAERAGTDPNKITWVSMDGAAMAAQLIAKNLDAAPFYSIHHYYQNKAAKAAGEEIVVLPFVEVGFKIFAATIIASDKMIAEKPDLTKRFLRAIKKTFEFARDNPEETCKLHVAEDPRGRARRLPGQRARDAGLRLQRPLRSSSAGARRARSGSTSPGRPSPRPRSSSPNGTTSRRSTPRSSRNEPARVIEIENVSKHFVSRDRDRVAALSDVSISIRRNEFVCLVGPSGCGKSTLLRLVGGLLPVSQGRVVIDGQPVAEPRAETGIVFQSPTLLPWASVLDNVLFPLKMMKRITRDSPDRAKSLLKLVGLEGFEGKYPRELSGGMQMRAGICRALVHDPDILLMDEPFSSLDALTREELTLELHAHLARAAQDRAVRHPLDPGIGDACRPRRRAVAASRAHRRDRPRRRAAAATVRHGGLR